MTPPDTTIEWRPVTAAPDQYLVSERGDVFKFAGRHSPRLLKPHLDHGGYAMCSFSVKRGAAAKHHSVHGLVAGAFIGPRPPGADVRHLDGNKANNHYTNLAYGTRRENCADTIRHGRTTVGERSRQSKITEAQVAEMRARYAGGETAVSIGQRLGISDTTARKAISGRLWRHVPGPVALRVGAEVSATVLSSADAGAIRWLAYGDAKTRDMCVLFGVGGQHITAIRTGCAWVGVPAAEPDPSIVLRWQAIVRARLSRRKRPHLINKSAGATNDAHVASLGLAELASWVAARRPMRRVA